ncbi:alpha-L-fucosidase [bacterium]|nr:alpha-L-fucosidase [bacterium]
MPAYQPTWDSLTTHAIPEWLLDAKFGLYAHLIDRVSRGGGLVLSLSPKADGTIPESQRKVLLEVGDWLRVSGEAIYGTRPWRIHAEGPLDKFLNHRPRHPRWTFDQGDSGDIRFTTKGDTLYTIALGWPEDGTLLVRSLAGAYVTDVALLGTEEPVTWECTPICLHLHLPPERPNEIAYSFRIESGSKWCFGRGVESCRQASRLS